MPHFPLPLVFVNRWRLGFLLWSRFRLLIFLAALVSSIDILSRRLV